MQEAQEAGLKDGVALSIHGPLGEIVGIGLASSSGRVNTGKDVLAEIHAIVNQFHLCHLSIVGKECSNINEIVPSLSEREKTILTWAAKNKSNSVISEIMNISPKTVEFHLANSYKKLGVNGRVMAVLMAFRLGLIFI
jgi:DNA-binding CsgD family transcriptional regulator